MSASLAPLEPSRPAVPVAVPRGGTWIDDWRPEDGHYWETTGRHVARRNLLCSVFAEHVGFSIWLLFSVCAAFLPYAGFPFTVSQLFFLVALPNLVGALVRLPYTFAMARFGGRNWAVTKTLLLLVPTLGFAWFVQRPDTPYWVFVALAFAVGLGGGGFASSMANINFFFPAHRKGAALGVQAASGNLGAAALQFFLPIVVGASGVFGLVHASSGGLRLERAGYLYAALALAAAVCAFRYMNNLRAARSTPREVLSVVRHTHTWVMSVLYIGSFGSFIGYAAAMPLLIRLNFWVPDPDNPLAPGTGINFVYYAFLGSLVGALTRPVGGWLADRFGGARVTCWAFATMVVGSLGVLWTLSQLTPNPAKDPAVATANETWFPLFLGWFLILFAATGVGNGSTYRMIPTIFRHGATHLLEEDTDEHRAATAQATRDSSSVIGIAGAVGALGGFLIPMTFGAPWVEDPVEAVRNAFALFTCFYALCLALTWFVYTRKRLLVGWVSSLAHVRI